MSDDVARAIDPTEDDWRAALAALTAQVYGVAWEDLPGLRALAGERRQGVSLYAGPTADGGGEVWLRVCWWSDPLRRTHWHAAPAWNPDDSARHPLEWVAPPLSCGRRERGGVAEFVVICRCGVAGPPDAVGWMGQTCGPCFDREQEGLPPAGLPILRMEDWHFRDFVLAGNGRLVSWFDHTDQRWVQAWDPPWTGPAAWTWCWISGCQVAVSADGSRYVLAADGNYVLGDAATGQPRDPQDMLPLRRVALAGAGGSRLVGVNFWEAHMAAPMLGSPVDCYSLHAYCLRPNGWLTEHAFGGEEMCFSRTPQVIAVSPDGGRVVAEHGGEVRAWEARGLRCADRMRLTRAGEVSALLAPAGGAVVATGGLAGSPWLLRWGPPARTGVWGWFRGPPLRDPDRMIVLDAPFDRLAASPDGRWLAGLAAGRLILHDAQTLERRTSFAPAAGAFNGGLAFAPGGELVAGTSYGLAVYPWRDLFGVQ